MQVWPVIWKKGRLEAIRVISVIETENLWKPTPHLHTKWKCPYQVKKTIWIIVSLFDDIWDFAFIK
jgi:hypothetical protein